MTTNISQRLTIFINPILIKQARAQAIIEDLTLSNLVERALIEYLPKETAIKKVDIGEGVKNNVRINKNRNFRKE